MKTTGALRTLVLLTILFANIGCDQISKGIVRQKLGYYSQITLLKQHLTLTKVENTGAFLSVGSSLPEPLKIIFLKMFPVIALCLALVYVLSAKNLSTISAAGICFFIGGGIGNIYDRLVYGSVTDFVHIDFVIFQTGIFNMADVSIVMGSIIIFVDALRKRESHRNLFG